MATLIHILRLDVGAWSLKIEILHHSTTKAHYSNLLRYCLLKIDLLVLTGGSTIIGSTRFLFLFLLTLIPAREILNAHLRVVGSLA